jgi:D-alanyl-D-alanine carboxypeptidase/D-alanyl-D-alanine-endopeptidase (penicillin-binding protein 4)
MAPSGALSVQFNTLEIVVRPGASGQPPRVEVDPPCAHVIVDNRAVTGRGRPLSVRTLARGEHTVVELTGSLAPSRRSIRMRRRITDPSRFAGTTLAALLAQPGEHPLDVQLGVRPTNVRTLLVHRSAPLPEVLGSALEYSNNFTTEQVVRTLGHRMSGAPGDWHNGSEALRRFWTAAGLPADAIAFENASGLSREGRVTPHALVGLLRVATRSAEAMIDAMAVAGREGTLRGRLRHTHGRVRAKSGTLRGVSGLSGVITSRDGEPQLGFSILMGGRASAHRARRIQDRFVRTLVAHLDTRE